MFYRTHAAVSWLLSGGGGIISGGAIVDVNVKDELEKTPLHYAADEGRTAVLEVLLAAGADKGICDGTGRTALDWAILRGRDEITALLQ